VEGHDKLVKGCADLSGQELVTQIYSPQGISDPSEFYSFNHGGGSELVVFSLWDPHTCHISVNSDPPHSLPLIA
jgi:hypothetical protein